MSVNARKWLYERVPATVQGRIDRVRFAIGALPRVAPISTEQSADLRGGVVLSADLELAWAWRYAKAEGRSVRSSVAGARRTRENFRPLIRLFDQFEVGVSWATVGHLFLDSCTGHPDLPRLPHFTNQLWSFQTGDWFDCDPATNFRSAPEWYAPDLIEQIVNAQAPHDIACHSFSHINFHDDVCPESVAGAELELCQQIAREWDLELDAMVFPGNIVGNLPSVKANGFTSYRNHGRYHMGFPQKDVLGLWKLPGGLCWELPPGWPPEAWASALCGCIDHAVETGSVFHLWFHPSCEPVNIEQVFPAVLEHIETLRDRLDVVTMKSVSKSPNAPVEPHAPAPLVSE